MKSIRLNKEIREVIINKVKEAYTRNNPQPEVSNLSSNIIQKAAEKIYLKKAKPVLDLIQANPCLRRVVEFQGYLACKKPSGNICYVNAPISDANNGKIYVSEFCSVIDFYNEDELAKCSIRRKAVEQYNKELRKEQKQQRELTSWKTNCNNYLEQVRQVIYGVNTTKQLMEVWPELVEYIPVGYQDPSNISLPSVNVASLNAKLGK